MNFIKSSEGLELAQTSDDDGTVSLPADNINLHSKPMVQIPSGKILTLES